MTTRYILNDIICEDSKRLSQFVKPNSVALTITSPPYRNAIDYSRHVENINTNQKARFRGNLQLKTSDYIDEMEKIFSEVYKVTIPGGFCCIIIGDEIDNGTLVPLSSLLISRLVNESDEEGWHVRDIIIWNKVTAGRNGAGNRFGIFVQNPIPTYYRSNIMHEYIIVLQKGKTKRELDKKTVDRLPLNRAMKRQVSLSIWDITPVPPRSVPHPAVFPEQIPWRLINLYSLAGDTILDPMNGSGQTTKIAKKLNRNYIGVDKREEYVKLAKSRLDSFFSLSNFMIPLYFPIPWSQQEQSGKKDDAELDITALIPRGYESVFQNESAKEVRGIRGKYIYYKNKEEDYICFIIGGGKKPTRLKLGKLTNPRSRLQIVLNSLPNKPFHKAELHEYLPMSLIENRQPLKAVIDVLENLGFIKKTGKKHRSSEVYEKTQTMKSNKLSLSQKRDEIVMQKKL